MGGFIVLCRFSTVENRLTAKSFSSTVSLVKKQHLQLLDGV